MAGPVVDAAASYQLISTSLGGTAMARPSTLSRCPQAFGLESLALADRGYDPKRQINDDAAQSDAAGRLVACRLIDRANRCKQALQNMAEQRRHVSLVLPGRTSLLSLPVSYTAAAHGGQGQYRPIIDRGDPWTGCFVVLLITCIRLGLSACR